MMKFVINTDGGARHNPGPAASSYIIRSDDGVIRIEQGVYIGVGTNNDAEYLAVMKALERLIRDCTTYLPAEVEIRADSLLVVKQLSNLYKVKNDRLREIYNEIKLLEKKIGQVIYTYIPREQNSAADLLVNQVLDKETGRPKYSR